MLCQVLEVPAAVAVREEELVVRVAPAVIAEAVWEVPVRPWEGIAPRCITVRLFTTVRPCITGLLAAPGRPITAVAAAVALALWS